MRSCLALLVFIAGLPAATFAQDGRPSSTPQQSAATPPAAIPDPPIDPSKLGVSISNIRKGLFIAAERDTRTGDAIRIAFNIQVYGTAPKVELLKGVDLFNGGVPGTAPTHRQMIEFVTPVIYRSPTMPVSALALWAQTAWWQKFKRARCEEEIARYRELLMQGVNVPAPRCTQ